jgi:hypothetical protein
MNRASLRQRLWDENLGLPKINPFFGLVIWPIFGLAVVLNEWAHLPTISNDMMDVCLALSLTYTGNVIGIGVYRKASGYISSSLKRTIRSETEPESRELDRRIDDLSRELGTKLSLTPEKEALLNRALDNALNGRSSNRNANRRQDE